MRILALIQKNKSSLLFLSLLVILPFIATSFIVLNTVKFESEIYQLSTAQWLVVYFAFTLVMGLALTHTTFVALFGGFFLGWESALFLFPAYILASVIGYTVAKRIDQGKLLNTLTEIPGVSALVNGLHKSESLFIFFCRLSPVLPFALMNALLSLLNVNFYRFLLAGSLGMLPRSLLFIWLGMQARNLAEIYKNPTENLPSKLVFIGLLIVSIAGLLYVISKASQKASKSI